MCGGQHTKIRFHMGEINAFPCKVERKELWRRMSEPQSRMATGTFSGHIHFGIKALKLCTSTHHLGSLHLRPVCASPIEDYWSFMAAPLPPQERRGLESRGCFQIIQPLTGTALSVFQTNLSSGTTELCQFSKSVPATGGNKTEVRRVHFA